LLCVGCAGARSVLGSCVTMMTTAASAPTLAIPIKTERILLLINQKRFPQLLQR